MKAKSFTHVIYIAGDYDKAVDVCRDYCEEGYCVSLDKTDYVYTGGMQSGVSVTLINYPPYPQSKEQIYSRAVDLGHILMGKLYQKSFTIVGPDLSYTHFKEGSGE